VSSLPSSAVPDTWPEALATVLSCRYDIGAGRAMAFGFPTSKRFRIRYNYFAPNEQGTGELHEGEFRSAKAMPQGTLFPIRYNPDATHEHHTADSPAPPPNPRRAQLIIGILGSLVLSLAWLLILRGCR
jgi:hypothetical protein